VDPHNIKVSVIMACHNSSAYLEEAVRSVLCQTLRDLELILIDDCSTDATGDIARHFQAQDNRVSVLTLPAQSGAAAARNAGIQAARGSWLGILDSDDVAEPTRFEKQLDLAGRDKNLVAIGSSLISIDAKGSKINEHRYPTDHDNLVKRLYSMGAFLPHSSMIYRRDVINVLEPFNPRYVRSEDYDLWLRLSVVGKFASIDKPLVKIRRHERGISHSESGRRHIILANAGIICHFLRCQGFPDPSVLLDDVSWQCFVDWTERRLNEEGVFDRRSAWEYARSGFFSTESRPIGVFRFATRILLSGHAGAALVEKYTGSSVPKRLAQEWMERSSVILSR
jgi:glycosyltransferase involved in cell wall biosynthesis